MDKHPIIEHIEKIILYNWKDELRNFEETYGVEIQSQDDLQSWITVCEANDWNHIFYTLMVLKQEFDL